MDKDAINSIKKKIIKLSISFETRSSAAIKSNKESIN